MEIPNRSSYRCKQEEHSKQALNSEQWICIMGNIRTANQNAANEEAV